MTNAIESEELTRVGPGTPMGELMRQYGIPPSKIVRSLQPAAIRSG